MKDKQFVVREHVPVPKGLHRKYKVFQQFWHRASIGHCHCPGANQQKEHIYLSISQSML
jgi:hypothetical protein